MIAHEFAPNVLLLNNRNGVFINGTAGRLPQINCDSEDIAIADFDQDGDLDRSSQEDNAVHEFYINEGNAFFTNFNNRLPISVTNGLLGRYFLDLDFDGDSDLIETNVFVNRPVKIFTNDGKGIFQERTSKLFPTGIVAEGLGMIAEDFNNDGLKDIYVVHRRTAQSLGNDRMLFRNDTATTGINFSPSVIPAEFELYQNYPNPFNPVTRIRIDVPVERIGNPFYTLTVLDALGKGVITLLK